MFLCLSTGRLEFLWELHVIYFIFVNNKLQFKSISRNRVKNIQQSLVMVFISEDNINLFYNDNIYHTVSAAKASVWDFGGTWSSDLAGVRFDMDVHSTVGMDKNMPVKILDRADCTKSNGFLNKGWMAKANAQYGRSGPVSLFAINRPEKTVAVFIGTLQLILIIKTTYVKYYFNN